MEGSDWDEVKTGRPGGRTGSNSHSKLSRKPKKELVSAEESRELSGSRSGKGKMSLRGKSGSSRGESGKETEGWSVGIFAILIMVCGKQYNLR
jgi:hypothetical protein